MDKDRYIALIINELKGTSSLEGSQLLKEWLAEKEEHREFRDQVVSDWENSLLGKKVIEVDVSEGYQRFKNRIAEEKSESAKIIPIKSSRRSWIWVAASILLLGAAWWVLRPSPEIGDQILASGLGEERTITLSDGTKVWLNENSKLTYPKEFNGSLRMITISGEAYFEVAKNVNKPFVVFTKDAEVKVLGTSFNLKNETDKVILTLDEGRVQFSKKNGTANLQLVAGESAILDVPANVMRKNSYNRNEAAWKTKMLVFQQVKLEDALIDIENYFGKTISLEQANLKECIFGGNFPKPDVNSVLMAVAAAFDMQLAQDRNGNYILKGGNCK